VSLLFRNAGLWTKAITLLIYIYVHENFAIKALAPRWDSWQVSRAVPPEHAPETAHSPMVLCCPPSVQTYVGLLFGCDLGAIVHAPHVPCCRLPPFQSSVSVHS